jgi:hypothetical protein
MKGAFGALHWSPDVFWKSTLTEYMAAIDGYNMVNGAKETEAPGDDDLADLVRRYG